MSTTVPQTTAYTPTRHVRIVNATSIFDGHDASINIIRRIFQASVAEVIHLGHNRSVKDIVSAAIQEDADAVAVSSYQGGHMEFFKFMVDLLREEGASHIHVFVGGGGTSVRYLRGFTAPGGVTKHSNPSSSIHSTHFLRQWPLRGQAVPGRRRQETGLPGP